MKTQTQNLLESTEQIPHPESPEATDQPRVPFQGNLELTYEQEERLIEHAMKRLDDLEKELGRNIVKSADWYQNVEQAREGKGSHLGKRERYEATWHNDVTWRPYILGGIFEKSNFNVTLVRRIVRQMVARANNYFFGTDPWFSAEPEGVEDRVLAYKVDRYAKFKLKQSRSRSSKENAVELAFIRGETVMKSTYRRKEDLYETTATVLVDIEGEPIMDSKGGYIFESDDWTAAAMVNELTGEPDEASSSVEVLARDPNIIKPEFPLWMPMKIPQRVTLFSGAESEPVYFKDFLCPLAAKSVQDADCVVHLYDQPITELIDQYRRMDLLDPQAADDDSFEALKRSVEMFRELAENDGNPKASRNQTSDYRDSDSVEHAESDADPIIEAAEFCLHFDANEDGIMENIFLVLDRKTRMPIYYEYVANVTPDGERPFTVIRPMDVDGHWYGVGAIEMFESTQDIVDLLMNRWNFSQSSSGRVTFWNPSATLEGQDNPHLKLNDGQTYTLAPGRTAEEALGYVTLPDIKYEYIQNMLEFFMQLAMNESGVQHANDANMVGLDQAKLATGIRNIEKSGMEMFSIFISKLEIGIQETLAKEIDLVFANLDEEEVFQYFSGDDDPDEQYLMNITPEDVRNLKFNVEVLLTRYKGEQVLQQAMVGIDAVEKYYSQHPMIQEKTTSFYRSIIKALDLKVNVEETISPVPLIAAPGANTMDPQQAQAAAMSVPNNRPPDNL
jgi:hypothetical protein